MISTIYAFVLSMDTHVEKVGPPENCEAGGINSASSTPSVSLSSFNKTPRSLHAVILTLQWPLRKRSSKNTPTSTVEDPRRVMHAPGCHSIPVPREAPHATRPLYEASPSVWDALVPDR